jgi:hypothetical protein
MATYPPPTENLPIFNKVVFAGVEYDGRYLKIEADTNLFMNGGDIDGVQTLGFEDGTFQTTAFTGNEPGAIALSNVLIDGDDALGNDITNLGTLNFSNGTNQTTAYDNTITITETNTDATYYPVFASGTGLQIDLRADASTTPFSINPNTSDFNVGTTLNLTQNSVAVGKSAGTLTNAIAINASGSALNPASAGCFIDPIRLDDTLPIQPVCYNNTTKELFYASSAKFVYLKSTPAGYSTKIYGSGSVVFGGLVAPFLSVKSTNGLTNSGTNGWVRTATIGAEGRFYSPTATSWLVNIVSNYTASYNSLIIARIYNSAGVLQSGRYVSSNEPGSNDAFTFIAEMNAGDYLQFQTDAPVSNPGLQLQYDNELYTSLQIRELL